MPKFLDPQATYAHRRPDAVVVNMTFDREAVEILHRYCPHGRKTTGKFVARLLYEHDARQQERQRQQEGVQSALEEPTIVG